MGEFTSMECMNNEHSVYACACVCVCVQLYPTLFDTMECSLPGSSVPGLFQARIQKWVAIPFHLQGIFPIQGSDLSLLCLLHWQAGSLTLVSPEFLQRCIKKKICSLFTAGKWREAFSVPGFSTVLGFALPILG